MGAAQSSNTAKAIAEVANSVSSNTSTTQSQIQSIRNNIKFQKCQIDGDVNIDLLSEFSATSKQIVQAFQQTHVQNQIAQQMQQLAQSTVGSLGIGFAEANNYVSTYASATTDIANYVFTVSDQASFQDTSVTCSNSVIGGDFNINLSSTTSFWNDQGVQSKQITDIANTITQTVSQKAVAKVEGLAGLLIILAIIIGLIGYAISKPAGNAFRALGPAFGFIAIAVIIFLVIYMYVKATPPFFSEQQTCSPTGNLGGSNCSFNECVDAKRQTVSIDKPPLKYMYNIIGVAAESKASNNLGIDKLGMLNMVIYSSANSSNYQFNQGYNALACKQWAGDLTSGDTWGKLWNRDTTYKAYGVPQLPNPFFIASVRNKDGDLVYCKTPSAYNYNTSPDSDSPDSQTPSVYTCMAGLDDDAYIKKSDFAKLTDNQLLGITAQLNQPAWNSYFIVEDGQLFGDTLEQQKLKRALHARYILTLANSLDNTIYIFDGTGKFPNGDSYPAEEVSYRSETILSNSDTAKKYCYKYTSDGYPLRNDYTKMMPVNATGVLTGNIGVCHTRQNKLNHFLTDAGNWIFLVLGIIVLVVLIFVFIRKVRNKNTE